MSVEPLVFQSLEKNIFQVRQLFDSIHKFDKNLKIIHFERIDFRYSWFELVREDLNESNNK